MRRRVSKRTLDVDRPDEWSVPTMSDVDVLNQTLAVEFFGIAAYDAALSTGLLDGPTADAARAFRSDHMKHRDLVIEAIMAKGGTPVSPRAADDYAKAYPPLTTANAIVAYAIELEAAAARAYIASVPEYEDRSLALLGAEIGGVEAQHWAVLLAASGANPVPSPIIDVKAASAAH
jgi:bacterioferritin (cytochrome b1)